MDSQAVERVVSDLNAQGRIRLLEYDVPNVQRSVHFRGEVNARSRRTPTGVRQVVLGMRPR